MSIDDKFPPGTAVRLFTSQAKVVLYGDEYIDLRLGADPRKLQLKTREGTPTFECYAGSALEEVTEAYQVCKDLATKRFARRQRVQKFFLRIKTAYESLCERWAHIWTPYSNGFEIQD